MPITQADYDFMHEQALKAMESDHLFPTQPIYDAAEYIAIAQYSEGRMLRAKFFGSLKFGTYYTAKRAALVITILDQRTTQMKRTGTR